METITPGEAAARLAGAHIARIVRLIREGDRATAFLDAPALTRYLRERGGDDPAMRYDAYDELPVRHHVIRDAGLTGHVDDLLSEAYWELHD